MSDLFKIYIVGVLIMLNPLISVADSFNNSFGVRGDDISFMTPHNYHMPEAKGDKVATLNKTGYMKIELDQFSRDFINYAAKTNKPVLEVGAAYGAAAIPALKKGATVIANDIAKEHLAILQSITPKEHLNHLFLNLGYFPDETNFPNNSLSAVLLSRVAHFLNGNEIEHGFKKVYDWLIPGGKFYFVSLSPYHHLLKEKFLPIYIDRMNKGYDWPGIIHNMKEYNPQESNDIPNFLHVFDEYHLKKILLKQGFIVERIQLFDYSNNSSKSKGYIGFVAIKL